MHDPLPTGPIYDLADWIQLFGIVPGLYFVIDYGILSLRRVEPEYRWYRSGIGTMFFAIGLAFVVTGIVVTLSLTLGVFYPGREWVRLAGYTIATSAMVWMAIVYTVERLKPTSVLVPAERREEELQRHERWREFEKTQPRPPRRRRTR